MIIFLSEETSMQETLRGLLPTLFPDWREGIHWRCIPHEGKTDLEKSIPRKLKGWRKPGDCFVVLRDQDSAECWDVKARLLELCRRGEREDTLIRIACHELESWFLGDLSAVEASLGVDGLAAQQNRSKFRDPDCLGNPAEELAKLTSRSDKVARAREISPYLNPDRNRSRSFTVFVDGLCRLVASQL